jgi:hypothetical protein
MSAKKKARVTGDPVAFLNALKSTDIQGKGQGIRPLGRLIGQWPANV